MLRLMRSKSINIHYIRLINSYIGRVIVPNKERKSYLTGQVLVEYGIILVLVVSAIIGLQLYVQRGLQGRYRAVTD